MKITALIPARAGSKRIKNKNIRELNGVPLLVYSIISAIEVGWDPVVSTDSAQYADIARKYGAEVIIRPPEICGDDAGDLEVVLHFLQEISPDLIAYLRPTTPFRTETVLRDAMKTFCEAGEYASSLRSVELMGETAFKCFTLVVGLLRPITKKMEDANLPNQLLTPTYRGNGYVDLIRPEMALAGDLWGKKCIGYVTRRVVELDDEEDFSYAQWLAERRKWIAEVR